MSKFARGIVATIVGAAMWGLSGACAQYLYAHYTVSPLFITVVRMLGAGALFMAYLLAFRRELMGQIVRDRASVVRLIIFGCVGLFLCQLTYTEVVNFTNAGTATVLQSSSVVLVMLVTCLLERRLPHVRELAGLVCAMVATVLIATKGNLGTLSIPPAGLAWGMANAASVTFYVMYPHRLFQKWGSMPVTGSGMLLGGFAALAVLMASEGVAAAMGAAVPAIPAFGLDGIAVLALIVLVGTFAAFGLYLYGVSVVGGVKGSLLGTMEPVSATVLSALWLQTSFTAPDWAGLVLMLLTTVLVSVKGAQEHPAAQLGQTGATELCD